MTKKRVVMTFMNMMAVGMGQNLVQRVASKIQRKQGESVQVPIVYFDPALEKKIKTSEVGQELHGVLAHYGIQATDELEIYICGHGDRGLGYIVNDDNTAKATHSDIAELLKVGLRDRATKIDDWSLTTINMVSCLFGRTTTGNIKDSPGGIVHELLRKKTIFVKLIARTEVMFVTQKHGKGTSGALFSIRKLHGSLMAPAEYKRKYTKVRWIYKNGVPCSEFAEYDSGRQYVETSSALGKSILWADHTTDELIDRITLDRRTHDFKDARHSLLYQVLNEHEIHMDPRELFDNLSVFNKGSIGMIELAKKFRWGKPLNSDFNKGKVHPNTIARLLNKYPK